MTTLNLSSAINQQQTMDSSLAYMTLPLNICKTVETRIVSHSCEVQLRFEGDSGCKLKSEKH